MGSKQRCLNEFLVINLFPVSGDVAKFGRADSASPAPATTLAQPQQNQTQTHHTAQQPFLNPTLPPGYSYTGLPYYAGMPGVPSAFQYGPTMFVSILCSVEVKMLNYRDLPRSKQPQIASYSLLVR